MAVCSRASAHHRCAPGTVVAVTLTLALLVGVGLLLWQLRDVLRWIVIAVFLAVALSPAVDRLQKRGVRRALAVGIVFVVLLLVIAGMVAVVFPPFVTQAEALVMQATALTNNPSSLDRALNDLTGRFGLTVSVEDIRAQLQGASSSATSVVGPLLSATRGVFSSITAIVSILLMTFFFLLDGERFVAAGLNFFAANHRPRIGRLLGESSQAVYGYVRGALSIATICGIITFIVLTILQMPYAVALALLIALFDLIPLVGATIGAAIVVIVAFFVDPVKGTVLLIYFIVYQQVENNLFQPLIYGRNVKLHPLAIFIAVLCGGQLLGILGTLLAIPVAEIIRILIVEYLVTRARANDGRLPSTEAETPVERVTADAAGAGSSTEY